jgi:23S rRNA pseudouridine1911/1915/1917 synthase
MSEPFVVEESTDWVLAWKPHGMPSAPLAEGECGTLLAWVLERYPDAASVVGKKTVECGLVHRLDTATEGLVLIARTQLCYDSLWKAQRDGLIEKTYYAFCSPKVSELLPGNGRYPFLIESRFRAFGPGRREVRPLFSGMRGYIEAGQDYLTIITGAVFIDSIPAVGVMCTLTKGFRHQIRSHLSHEGFPILGDELYNPAYRDVRSDVPLQLHAIGISFPDFQTGKTVFFSLPQPDKMTR